MYGRYLGSLYEGLAMVNEPLPVLRTTPEPRVVMPSNAVVPSTEDVSATLTLNFSINCYLCDRPLGMMAAI